MISLLKSLVLLAFITCSANGIAQERLLFSPQGYRIADYRSPLPTKPPAGQRIDTLGLQRLIDEDTPALIDVQAITLRPESADFGLSWLPSTPRQHLSGSIWLPNVGYGYLEPCLRRWFEHHLQLLSGGDADRALVFYCVTDCWMSWNAVKRAAELGYRNLYWYPEGSDGWADAGLPLVSGEPTPLPGMAEDDNRTSLFECPANDLQQLLARVASSDRSGLLLFFESDDCPYCRRMYEGVLASKDSVDHYQKDYLAAALDLESESRLTGFDGKVTTARALAKGLGVVRTPTMIFFDPVGEERYRYSGVIADPERFRALADYVSSGYQEQMSLREYLDSRR